MIKIQEGEISRTRWGHCFGHKTDPQVSSVWRVFPRIADFFRAKRGKLAGLPTQPGLGHWKVQDPRSALVGLLHPMSSMGLLTRFQLPENIYVIFFFPKDFPQVNKAYVLDNNEWDSTNIFLLKNVCPYQVYPIFQHNEGHNFIFVVLITSLFQIWEDQISKRLGFIMKLLFSLENVETSMGLFLMDLSEK